MIFKKWIYRNRLKMSIVRDLMKRFPTRLIRTGFGYGSSVFPQKGNDGKDRQIDMILIVDDVAKFHQSRSLLFIPVFNPF
jgi:hypothetical protein